MTAGRIVVVAVLLLAACVVARPPGWRAPHELLLFFPSVHPAGDWDPRGLAFEDVWIEREGGERAHGWYVAADDPVAVAKYWAAEAGQRVGYACQHLHGGIGSDVDYPLHRYYLWAKQSELALGSAPVQLERLGDRLAAGSLVPGD